jgi:predicted metal-dependent phosphoesterase TrpH
MRAFVDLHCHSRGSFDCLSAPKEIVRAASERGLTHLAITDHDRIDVALEARQLAPAGLTVIVGEEVKTRDGDLICIFLEHAIPPGLSAAETIAAAREQGGLVGIPHPFDNMRGSLLREAAMASLAPLVDWVETHNARVVGHGNEDAADFALEHERPGISVSDAHSIMEIGVAYTALDGDPSTPAGLLAALSSAEIVPGRASYFVRLWTPVAKGINRLRGNIRVEPAAASPSSGRDGPA